MSVVPLMLLLAGCGSRQAPEPDTGAQSAAAVAPVTGLQTFAIVPAESKASYHASEEFFPAALARLGIDAGRAEAVGTTQAIEGRFQLDPERPAAPLGDNTFTVRLNTLTSNQSKRSMKISTL